MFLERRVPSLSSVSSHPSTIRRPSPATHSNAPSQAARQGSLTCVWTLVQPFPLHAPAWSALSLPSAPTSFRPPTNPFPPVVLVVPSRAAGEPQRRSGLDGSDVGVQGSRVDEGWTGVEVRTARRVKGCAHMLLCEVLWKVSDEGREGFFGDAESNFAFELDFESSPLPPLCPRLSPSSLARNRSVRVLSFDKCLRELPHLTLFFPP